MKNKIKFYNTKSVALKKLNIMKPVHGHICEARMMKCVAFFAKRRTKVHEFHTDKDSFYKESVFSLQDTPMGTTRRLGAGSHGSKQTLHFMAGYLAPSVGREKLSKRSLPHLQQLEEKRFARMREKCAVCLCLSVYLSVNIVSDSERRSLSFTTTEIYSKGLFFLKH